MGSSNPKAILFFTAFFPQFLNPVEPLVPQYSILALTFIACEFGVLAMCAFGVSAIAPVLRSRLAHALDQQGDGRAVRDDGWPVAVQPPSRLSRHGRMTRLGRGIWKKHSK